MTRRFFPGIIIEFVFPNVPVFDKDLDRFPQLNNTFWKWNNREDIALLATGLYPFEKFQKPFFKRSSFPFYLTPNGYILDISGAHLVCLLAVG